MFALNLLWFTIGLGVIAGLLWCLAGIICFVSIIGIPFGFACFRIASFAFFPFGKDIIPAEMIGERTIPGTKLVNFLWCLLFGWWFALLFALAGFSFCFSLIGIPFGIADFHLAKVAFAPLGKRIVDKDMGKMARERWTKGKLDAAFSETK